MTQSCARVEHSASDEDGGGVPCKASESRVRGATWNKWLVHEHRSSPPGSDNQQAVKLGVEIHTLGFLGAGIAYQLRQRKRRKPVRHPLKLLCDVGFLSRFPWPP